MLKFSRGALDSYLRGDIALEGGSDYPGLLVLPRFEQRVYHKALRDQGHNFG